MIEQPRLQLVLAETMVLGKTGELQDVRIADGVVDSHDTFLGMHRIHEAVLVLGHAGSFVEESFDLALELCYTPAASDALNLVEGSFECIVSTHEFNKMGEGEMPQ